MLVGFEGTAASVEVGNSSVTAFVCSWVVVVGNVVEGCLKVVFLSINRVDDEGTVPLLLSPVLGRNCEGKKLALGGSLLSETLTEPLDSLALVPLSDGKKLNLGGSLLSKDLGAVWLEDMELKSNTGVELVWFGVPLGLPKVVAAWKGFGRAEAVVIGFGLKGVAVGFSRGACTLTGRMSCGLPDLDRDDTLSSSDSPTKRDSLFATDAFSTSEATSINPCDCA